MTTISFARFLTLTATVKRNLPVYSGKILDLTTTSTTVKVTPPMPLDAKGIERYRLQSPRSPMVCYAGADADVQNGDALTILGNEYLVVGVGQWPSDMAFAEIALDLAMAGV